MDAETFSSAADYLRTTFPDREPEYVRGEIVERGMPDYVHSVIQPRLTYRFMQLALSHPVRVCSELRLQVEAEVYRVADVAIFAPPFPTQPVPERPPFVVMEIVSKDDRYVDILDKLREYLALGVRHVWLIDPWLRQLHAYSESGLTTLPALSLPEYQLEITLHELLQDLPQH